VQKLAVKYHLEGRKKGWGRMMSQGRVLAGCDDRENLRQGERRY
jgi:hypothetical protein